MPLNDHGEDYGWAVAVRVRRRTGGTNHDAHFRCSAALGSELNLHTYAHPIHSGAFISVLFRARLVLPGGSCNIGFSAHA